MPSFQLVSFLICRWIKKRILRHLLLEKCDDPWSTVCVCKLIRNKATLSKKASHSCILRFWLALAPNQTKPSNLNWLWQKLREGRGAVLSLGSWYHSKVLCPLNACDIFAKSMWQSDDTKCDINVTSMLHCDIHATSVTSLRSPHDANVTPFPSELCSWGRFNSSYFNFNNAFHMYFLYCEFYIIQTNIFH